MSARRQVLDQLAARRTPDSSEQAFARLSEIVLTTPVGGRGPVDGGTSDSALLRVCVAVLSRLCERDPVPSSTRPALAPSGWWERRRGAVPVVIGTSPQAQGLRAACARVRLAGPPVVLVVGGSLDAMAAGLWRERVEGGSGVRWHRLWEAFVARDRLPEALDPVRLAERWRQRTAPARLHVLLAAPGEPLPDVARLLGTAVPRADHDLGADRSDTVDTDLLRRLNQSLATRPRAVRRAPYDGALADRFDHAWTGEPGVPEAFRAWAREQGERLAASLDSSDLSVLGDPGVVVPSDGVMRRRVPVAATLGRALDVLSSQCEGGDPWRAE